LQLPLCFPKRKKERSCRPRGNRLIFQRRRKEKIQLREKLLCSGPSSGPPFRRMLLSRGSKNKGKPLPAHGKRKNESHFAFEKEGSSGTSIRTLVREGYRRLIGEGNGGRLPPRRTIKEGRCSFVLDKGGEKKKKPLTPIPRRKIWDKERDAHGKKHCSFGGGGEVKLFS